MFGECRVKKVLDDIFVVPSVFYIYPTVRSVECITAPFTIVTGDVCGTTDPTKRPTGNPVTY